MSGLRIGIVGCGIAGMAAAIACAREGFRVTLIERFETPRPLGAGLLLQPSGLAALEALGLRAAVEARGARIATLDGRTREGRPVLELVYQRWAPDAFGLGVHRAALFDALHTALAASGADLRFGVEAVELDGDQEVTVHDAARRRHGPFDVLLIADGSHSNLRARALPGSKAPLFPWGALWTVRPDRSGRWEGALRQVYDGARRMAGVLPLGRAPGSPAPEAALFWSLRRDQYEAWRAAGLSAWRDEVASHWPAAARLLVGLEDPDAVAFATYRDVQAAPWSRGRALAIGDAAHGTSPQLGQGANLALADGVAIAAALSARPDAPGAALRLFRRMRRGTVGWTQLASRALTPAFQSDWRLMGWARDVALRDLARIPAIERLMLATLVGAVASTPIRLKSSGAGLASAGRTR
ncbi:MAG: FAD-dependent monooxygenase [Alphaproteobacteria bacterium]|nr:FAD-dependent monooxygenase [Alphaproteobacteria bacterium]